MTYQGDECYNSDMTPVERIAYSLKILRRTYPGYYKKLQEEKIYVGFESKDQKHRHIFSIFRVGHIPVMEGVTMIAPKDIGTIVDKINAFLEAEGFDVGKPCEVLN